MVERIGDWFAFSRSNYCRRLTLYDDLSWGPCSPASASGAPSLGDAVSAGAGGHTARIFSLAAVELVSMARFGGLIAVVGGAVAVDPDEAPPAHRAGALSLGDVPIVHFDLSAHSAAVAAAGTALHGGGGGDRAVQVFTNAGQLLATFPLTRTRLGSDTVAAVGWTPEGELYVVLSPSLTVLFAAMRDVAVAASAIGGADEWVSRRVQLRSPSSGTATAVAPAAIRTTPEGLLCVDGDGSGRLYGLLHEERFASSVLAPACLPLRPPPPMVRAGTAAAKVEARALPASAALTAASALDMVAPTCNDSGEGIVLWAQCHVPRSGALGHTIAATAGDEADVLESTLCAAVLPGSGATWDATAAATPPVLSARRVTCPGRVLDITVCAADPTQVAVFTSLGVLHVFRSNLSSPLFAIDVGVCRAMQDAALPLSPSGTSFGLSGGASRMSENALDVDEVVDGTAAAAAAAAAAVAVASPTPYKVDWCGSHFVLLHFYLADFQTPHAGGGGASRTRRAAAAQRHHQPMFSLVVCTERDCSVRCERLDWGPGGSGHIATVAEYDGVRVVTDTTCYLVQETPACLTRLCRVQPPYSPAAQVVAAYQTYASGDRRGVSQLRAALMSGPASLPSAAATLPGGGGGGLPDGAVVDDEDDSDGWEMPLAETVVHDLLDAASHEVDVEQQHRLIAAASFAGEMIHLCSGTPDTIVDVVRRLRVLRAVREEPRCHMSLSMAQYQLLTGSTERPARRLTSAEGQVLVDRLTYLGCYQTALDVARVMHMKPARVLSHWAASFIRRHAAQLSDGELHREVTQALGSYHGSSFVEPAVAAIALNRRELALRLLRDEPQQQRKRVLLCLQLGELAAAGRAAADSGSAELVHLVVSALVAGEAQSQHGEPSSSSPPLQLDGDAGVGAGADGVPAVVTLADVRHCVVASPELLCCLVAGAACLTAWQSLAQRLLFATHWSLAALECHAMLVRCLRLSSSMHRSELRHHVDERGSAARVAPEGCADDVEQTRAHRRRSEGGKHRRHRHRDRNGGDSNDGGSGDDGGDASPLSASAPSLLPLPPLSAPQPTAAVAAAALAEWTKRTHGRLHSALRRADELLRGSAAAPRSPFAVILDRADRVRARARHTAAVRAGQSAEEEEEDRDSTRPARSTSPYTADGAGGRGGGTASAASSVLAQEQLVRTSLCAPLTNPSKDAAALEREVKLGRLKAGLAVKHNTPRLDHAVVSVADLLHELCALPGTDADVAEVQRTFHVGERLLFYAQLRGFCAARRWDAVDRLVGPAPPLRKRSFFSGDGSGAAEPCVGYLPVVQLLAAHQQAERAARYVAGACTEAVDRVVWYMALEAPIMALEAAMVGQDAGLVQQIMQRVPGNATVQSTGAQMLAELRRV
ncbi:hypothetical protein NESM_000454600 [Novymonas esmeraldas]|uniref:Vps16 C-terminal domain-containing protein n=1 Tax=Novymonas esmeraldas TaxID=1808958 RepID=A0AAW0ER68_9TRYP